MFTSLLNTVCAYDPVGLGVPYNHLLFSDSVEPLVDTALQILIVTLDHDTSGTAPEGEEVCICTHCSFFMYFLTSEIMCMCVDCTDCPHGSYELLLQPLLCDVSLALGI